VNYLESDAADAAAVAYGPNLGRPRDLKAKMDRSRAVRLNTNWPNNPDAYQVGLCQNCVTYSPRPRGNTDVYGEVPTRIDVAGSR
jgi:hypothetical protein